MKKPILLISSGLASSLTACAPSMPAVQLNLNTAEYSAYHEVGTASVVGRAFLRQQGGGVLTCAGGPVFLFPDTPAFRTVIGTAKTEAEAKSQVDVRTEGEMQRVTRMTTCDAQGNFRFDHLPATAWMIGVEVRGEAGGPEQGGNLLALVSTSMNETARISLTDDNRL